MPTGWPGAGRVVCRAPRCTGSGGSGVIRQIVVVVIGLQLVLPKR